MTAIKAVRKPKHDIGALSQSSPNLTADDLVGLLSVEGNDFNALLDKASALRDAGLSAAQRPGVLTYSRKVFIPLTTLCRDRCHYCTFVDSPQQLLRKGQPMYMPPERVLAVAARGAAAGCKEALFTLGDRPEARWSEAADWLRAHGYNSTLEYTGAMARLVRDETGLLPHLNPGVMSYEEMIALRPVAASMGMMLETTSTELFARPGAVHFGSPDKEPRVRLQVLEDAGRARVPFTTGILVGIGETLKDRAESIIAIRDAHARYGHIQEVIVQNFRAKPQTAMRGVPDAAMREYLATVAVTRIALGETMRIQVPPNLTNATDLELLVRAGADDWGGVSPVTADHVNPERPWPHLDDLARYSHQFGFTLQERLTIHPEYSERPEEWLDKDMRSSVEAVRDSITGLARTISSQDAFVGFSRSSGGNLLDRAAAKPATLDDAEWEALLHLQGDKLDALTATADDVRRLTVGEAVSIVRNRNVASSAFRTEAGADEIDAAVLAAITRDAAGLGATELCVQGLLPPDENPWSYLDIARGVKQAAPGIHLHAFRPADIMDFAARCALNLEDAVAALREAGVDTVPGTGVKILSEQVRREVAPDDVPIADWLKTIEAVHRGGIRTSSVIVYGHRESAADRIAHLRRLMEMQDIAQGFTELVPIPHPDGVPLVPGRSARDEHRAMFAVARLMLSGTIAHIQVPWVKLGREDVLALLRSGGDDLGGTLFDGRVRPEIGAEAGMTLSIDEASRIAAKLFRPLRLRTTTYGDASPTEVHS